MQYILHTAATLSPLTTTELKAHLRVTHDLDNTYIDALQTAAVEAVQDYTFQQLLPATWKLILNGFPDDKIQVEKLPVTEITNIKYFDTDNVEQTLAADNYTTEIRTSPAIIEPVDSFPSTYSRFNAVEITFAAGYANAASVPDDIKHAIKLIVGNLYSYRDDLQQKPGLTKPSQLLLQKYVKPVI